MEIDTHVIFADNTSEPCSYLSYLPDLQYVYFVLDGADLTKAVDVLSDKEKLQRIQYGAAIIEGYVHVDYIQPLDYGVKVRLSPMR